MKSIFSPTYQSRRHRQPAPEQTEHQPFFSAFHEQTKASGPSFFPPAIQRLATPDEEKMPGTNDQRMREDKMIQEKPELKPIGGQEEDETVQRKTENSSSLAAPQISNQIENSQGEGQALPKGVRYEMETIMGVDFSEVNIHTDTKSVQLNKALGAQAFTYGHDIFFNSGKFQPDSVDGKYLLAHELTHIVQQQNAQKTIQRSCGDESVDWYNPFIRIASYDPTCLIQYANVDTNSAVDYNTDWKRDAVSTGLLSAVAGLATTVIGRRLGLTELAAMLFGATSAFARGYVGLTVKERIRGKIVDVYNWYGRYKYNLWSKEILAVDYQGHGPIWESLVIPWQYEQAIFDADGNIIGNFIYSNDMTLPGVPLDGDHLPTNSFGTI